MKVDGSIRSLIQGVSQQPARTRFPGQCTLQENCSSNPVEGLTRRPPIENLASLFASGVEPQFYDYDIAGTRYIVAITANDRATGTAVLDTGLDIDKVASVTITDGGGNYSQPPIVTFSGGGGSGAAGTAVLTDGAVTSVTMTSAGSSYETPPTVHFSGSAVRVFDTEGTEYDVEESASSMNYLDGGKLAFTTLDGETFIANTTKVTDMESATKTYISTGSIVFVLGGQYGRIYTINIRYSGSSVISVNYAAPYGATSSDIEEVTTTYIADQLENALLANGTFAASFTVARADDVLYIKKNDNAAIEITVEDGDGGNNMFVVNNFTKDISKLPRFAPQGYIVKVQGSSTYGSADVYLEFRIPAAAGGSAPASGAGFGTQGVWAESVAPGIEYLLDIDTMPHLLVFDGTDTFTFGAGAWLGRQVGDLQSNEDPSFIGDTINDMSHFQGRLVLLSGIACIMSRTNVPLDFFVKSATTSLDSDPIDIESTAKNVSKLDAAVPHNRDLIIFSSNAQFIVFGRNLLTPKNSSLVLTTTFEADTSAKPQAAGRNIFFGIKYGDFTGIREFYTEGSQDINDSRPITQHVLKYIPGSIEFMATTSNFNALLVHASGSDTELYLYEYIWLEDRKAQSSWSKWIVPNPMAYYFFVESIIYMVAKIENNYVLEKVDLDTQMDDGLTYQVLLDRKISVEEVETEIVAPWPDMPDIDDVVIVQGTGCPHPGLRAEIEDYDEMTSTITLKEDMEEGTVILGVRYLSRYKPTMPFVKDSDGVKVGTGKLVVSKFLVNYRDSGGMYAKITSAFREDEEIYFSGRVVNDPNTAVGEAVIQSGTFEVPFRDDTDNAELELFTDSETPFTMMDIEWIGQYTKRGKRIAQGGDQ